MMNDYDQARNKALKSVGELQFRSHAAAGVCLINQNRWGMSVREFFLRRRHAIAVLLGRFPEDPASELAKSGGLPSLPSGIPVGISVDLLRRRPDIAEAERRVAAATGQLGMATNQLFPALPLTSSGCAQGGFTRQPAHHAPTKRSGAASRQPRSPLRFPRRDPPRRSIFRHPRSLIEGSVRN